MSAVALTHARMPVEDGCVEHQRAKEWVQVNAVDDWPIDCAVEVRESLTAFRH